METLTWIVLSTIVVSLLSLVGILTLFVNKKIFNKILLALVALSAGALMGGAFLHLIPEAIEMMSVQGALIVVLFGFVLFYLIEKVFQWRHCHKGKCDVHTFAYMNLFGESIHNFLDGLIIAASFVAGIPLGIITTVAVALHEIPQEIGDFGVLVYGGFSKKRALLLNFLVSLLAVAGGIIGFSLSSSIEGVMPFLIALAAGGFLYISATDLIPEIKKEVDFKKSLYIFLVYLLGIAAMILLLFLE